MRAFLETVNEPLLLSPFIVAELDYLLLTRHGRRSESLFLSDVARGVYRLEHISAHDIDVAEEYLARYEALELGVADASNVVIAARHKTAKILTLDERHFRAITPLTGEPSFVLLPGDA